MARKKISELESATDVTANDLIQIVDVEDDGMAITGTNKKITASLLARELAKQPLEPGVVISGSSSGDALRITQTGSGNALVVEDSTNPDSTPFVIDSSGRLISGSESQVAFTFTPSTKIEVVGENVATSSIAAVTFNGTAGSPSSMLLGRGRGTQSSPIIVNNNDDIGFIQFEAHDGDNLKPAVRIFAEVDGTPGVNNMPGRLVFGTTPDGSASPVEVMRITSAGSVGIGTASIESNCLLKLASTTKGFRPPSMTTTERNAISTPIAGLMIYNNSTNKLNFYNGSAWEAVTSSV